MYRLYLNENAAIFQPGGRLQYTNIAKVNMTFGSSKDINGYLNINPIAISPYDNDSSTWALNVSINPTEMTDDKWDFFKEKNPMLIHLQLADAVESNMIIIEKDGVALTPAQIRG
jgi:hypothetical protein